jgi:hypothetical protein
MMQTAIQKCSPLVSLSQIGKAIDRLDPDA